MDLTLRAGVHNDLGNHASQEVLDQTESEAEANPVVPVFESLQAVAVEIDITVKVHLVESLHGDLVLAMVLRPVFGLLEGQVVLHGAAGELGLLGLPRGHGRDNEPEGTEKRGRGEDGEEDCQLQTTANLP